MAELGVADLLSDGPKDTAFLASATATHANALYRVLRMLSGVGIFIELPDRKFQQSPLSEVLRSDAPGSVRDYARWLGTSFHWRFVSDLDYSVRTGKSAVVKDQPGKSPFEVLAEDTTAQKTFNDAMTGLSMGEALAIVEAYDFSSFARITEVGAGHGTLAAMISQAAPNVHVTVFDLPHVIQGCEKRLTTDFPAAKITTVAGNFFDHVPGPTDLCVLKHIIHDWDDADAVRILTRCREALADGGRVLVCEMMITQDSESMPARIPDIEMMAGPGGRERTKAEFSELFHEAGLQLVRVVPTRTRIHLFEATAVARRLLA